jgi:sugar phosphate isomerase/epimerase
VPGTWGQEVPVGTGQVDWRAFFTTLRDNGFKGNFVIEREAGNDRVGDIKKARQLVQNLSN